MNIISEIWSWMHDIPIHNAAMSLFLISIVLGVNTYMILVRKRWYICIITSMVVMGVLIFGIKTAYPLILWFLWFYVYKLELNKWSLIKSSIIMIIIMAASCYWLLDYRIPISLCIIYIMIVSIINEVKFSYLALMLLNVFLIWSGSDAIMCIAGLMGLLTNGSSFQKDGSIISLGNFKKYYLKKVVDYRYLIISLHSDEVDSLSKEEKEEMVNFLDIIKDDAISIMVDDFTYILAFSNIKTSFGSSNAKVNEDNEALMETTSKMLKSRLMFPLWTATHRVLDFRLESVDSFDEVMITIQAMKNAHEKRSKIMNSKIKGLRNKV